MSIDNLFSSSIHLIAERDFDKADTRRTSKTEGPAIHRLIILAAHDYPSYFRSTLRHELCSVSWPIGPGPSCQNVLKILCSVAGQHATYSAARYNYYHFCAVAMHALAQLPGAQLKTGFWNFQKSTFLKLQMARRQDIKKDANIAVEAYSAWERRWAKGKAVERNVGAGGSKDSEKGAMTMLDGDLVRLRGNIVAFKASVDKELTAAKEDVETFRGDLKAAKKDVETFRRDLMESMDDLRRKFREQLTSQTE